jgi:hypothetical protein
VGTATPHEHFEIGRRLVRLDSGPACQQYKNTQEEAPISSAQCV